MEVVIPLPPLFDDLLNRVAIILRQVPTLVFLVEDVLASQDRRNAQNRISGTLCANGIEKRTAWTLHPAVAELGQLHRIAFACEDRGQDGLTAAPREVSQYMM